ncbi:hypothetical protein ACHAWO_006400 [Cyclotella atomus]|uniref:HAT C-terminal dimerisation domain-containing protein n=1 Tax=Cyclotella atomus TaxID=382360 RepID=A0ABD3MZF8_9STRA
MIALPPLLLPPHPLPLPQAASSRSPLPSHLIGRRLVKDVDDTRAEWEVAKSSEAAANVALQEFEAQHNTSTANRRSRGNAINYAAMANPQSRPSAQSLQHKTLADAVEAEKVVTAEKLSLHLSARSKLEQFKGGKLITEEDFVAHGHKVVEPIFKDYNRLFLDSHGDFKNITTAYHAARVLNPLIAVKMTEAEIKEGVKDLKSFGFDEFHDGNGIIDNIIDEIPYYKGMLDRTGEDFWNGVEGATKYDIDLARKVVDNPDKYAGSTWKDDPIEKARRVWEWWRANHSNPGIFYFAEAARLVALVQISSAAVERIFSQVKLICETTGDSPLEENLEVRLFERCNVYPAGI